MPFENEDVPFFFLDILDVMGNGLQNEEIG